mmetsp:Transcript_35029/g.47320  ORF Transcript_35029/g.47320 Transcript_35029/m.47320 type:complete len:116 (+) Transcript_35029:942-1289(+)
MRVTCARSELDSRLKDGCSRTHRKTESKITVYNSHPLQTQQRPSEQTAVLGCRCGWVQERLPPFRETIETTERLHDVTQKNSPKKMICTSSIESDWALLIGRSFVSTGSTQVRLM